VEDTIAILVGLPVLLLCGGLYLWCVSWVIRDAQQRGYQSSFLLLVSWYCCGVLWIPIWFLIRPKEKVVDKPVGDYSNADDAIAAATQLDGLGEWDKALEVYQMVAARWPEHRTYIEKCMEAIRTKQSL
jgi:hypothetical protein